MQKQRQNEYREKNFAKNKAILEVYLSFAKDVDTFCVDEKLPVTLQDQLLKLLWIKKNTDVIIQNSEKRTLRRHSSEKPQDLMCRDLAFGNILWIQVDKVQRILELLIMDKQFEQNYPDLTRKFGVLHDSISDIEDKYKCTPLSLIHP